MDFGCSLAALQTLVHLNPAMRFAYQLFIIEFEENLVETIPPADLPPDWREQPPCSKFNSACRWGQSRVAQSVEASLTPMDPYR